MAELLDADKEGITQDYELVRFDFHRPVEVMGVRAAKETVELPEDNDDEDEIPYYGD